MKGKIILSMVMLLVVFLTSDVYASWLSASFHKAEKIAKMPIDRTVKQLSSDISKTKLLLKGDIKGAANLAVGDVKTQAGYVKSDTTSIIKEQVGVLKTFNEVNSTIVKTNPTIIGGLFGAAAVKGRVSTNNSLGNKIRATLKGGLLGGF